MKRKKRIEKILYENFSSWSIEVKDKSFLHRGHGNFNGKEETHFIIILQSKMNKKFKKLIIHRLKINKRKSSYDIQENLIEPTSSKNNLNKESRISHNFNYPKNYLQMLAV